MYISDPKNCWLNALRKYTNTFKYESQIVNILDNSKNVIRNIILGSMDSVVRSSALLCLKLRDEDTSNYFISELPIRIYLEEINNFSDIKNICPDVVASYLENGRVEMSENDIKEAFKRILKISFHQKDWGGENNDLYTANITVNEKIYSGAFMLKGSGTKNKILQIKNCGKNGDQLVRLCQSPAQIFFIQYVGEISQNIIKDIEGKIGLMRKNNVFASYCIINGQDTVRLLMGYKNFFEKKTILVKNTKWLIELVKIILLFKIILELHETFNYNKYKIELKTILELYLESLVFPPQ